MSERYLVQPGDSLWKIAQARLGDGHQWKRVWRYNNRADVMKVTGRGIPNADLIHPGQILLLPKLPAAPAGPAEPASTDAVPAAKNLSGATRIPPQSGATRIPPQSGATRISAQPLHAPPAAAPAGAPRLPPVTDIASPISIKYRLDDLRFPPVVQPGGIVEIRMTGDIILTSTKTYPAVYVTSRREIETQVVTAANQAFGSLFNDTRLIYDSIGNRLTYRSMFVAKSNVPQAMTTAIGVEFDSHNPIPKLRFEFRFPKIEGTVAEFEFAGIDIKIVVELTPKPERAAPSAQPLRAPEPAVQWTRVVGVGLLVVAGAIVVATLVEDFLTAGGGIVDDPASFAAAAASAARGLQMMRGAVLPAAAVPAAVNLSMRLENKGASSAVVRPPL
jgi:hypothetical protein